MVVLVVIPAVITQAGATSGFTRDDVNGCTLNCPDDAPCRFGSADFSGHVMELGETSHNGMHCECPMGKSFNMSCHERRECVLGFWFVLLCR
jgi:hypothetical protein